MMVRMLMLVRENKADSGCTTYVRPSVPPNFSKQESCYNF